MCQSFVRDTIQRHKHKQLYQQNLFHGLYTTTTHSVSQCHIITEINAISQSPPSFHLHVLFFSVYCKQLLFHQLKSNLKANY